jgi:hypothetical protein
MIKIDICSYTLNPILTRASRVVDGVFLVFRRGLWLHYMCVLSWPTS